MTDQRTDFLKRGQLLVQFSCRLASCSESSYCVFLFYIFIFFCFSLLLALSPASAFGHIWRGASTYYLVHRTIPSMTLYTYILKQLKKKTSRNISHVTRTVNSPIGSIPFLAPKTGLPSKLGLVTRTPQSSGDFHICTRLPTIVKAQFLGRQALRRDLFGKPPCPYGTPPSSCSSYRCSMDVRLRATCVRVPELDGLTSHLLNLYVDGPKNSNGALGLLWYCYAMQFP